MNVVIVESPAKAKTINKYLGKDYQVLASFGHVRDLPAKNGSVRPDEDFAMSWEVEGPAAKRLAEIAKAVKGADHLFLATDPDREGEAISWHIRDILAEKKVLGKVAVSRVVFNEITKSAIQAAFKTPRDLNQELIEAYLARTGMSARKFGVDAMSDPNFVYDIRSGVKQNFTIATLERCRAFMRGGANAKKKHRADETRTSA